MTEAFCFKEQLKSWVFFTLSLFFSFFSFPFFFFFPPLFFLFSFRFFFSSSPYIPFLFSSPGPRAPPQLQGLFSARPWEYVLCEEKVKKKKTVGVMLSPRSTCPTSQLRASSLKSAKNSNCRSLKKERKNERNEKRKEASKQERKKERQKERKERGKVRMNEMKKERKNG